MPAIRHRPKYPKLDKADEKERSAPWGDRCGKYYSEYGEKRLTGGIMVCWCPHNICYGFHCIPACEGCNNVFSAMVTRWPVAPEREPQFFGKTSFVIDHFHAAGHTKCSPAAFLSEYANADPKLSSINLSAAECGNSALRRICKSWAIIYTRVFLSIWNRVKALKARKKGRS
ncbi:hypothetical protein FA13DRAFT_1755972 [Coprinellus micaceus]|uniref:Uncharacterized protein n=1 Tax=Coprinellus micaceus TaxID=71717 RepID=A0A4Y7T1E4_COPMI|nr:hypothetical protein FA13DRAFT_1755972 [Coprinellus micaceus]